MRFYTQESAVGSKQSMTPEGFLLCEDVPVARTGNLVYADGEVPVDPDSTGLIHISRDPQEVFADSAISSFNGKPVTNDHPPEKVLPQNWREYTVGVTLNPRRGDGVNFDNDYLYADLLIHDADAIRDVQDGKREVSAGYDAEYEQLAPGLGRQTNIIGNHVALVDKGRCGPRCMIGDRDMPRMSFRDRIRQVIRSTKDEDTLVDELDKISGLMGTATDADTDNNPQHHVTVNLHGMREPTDDDDDQTLASLSSRLDAIEAALAALAQGGDGGQGTGDRRTRDRGRGRARDADPDDDDDDDRKTSDRRRTRDADEDDDDDDDDRKSSNDRRTGDRRTRDRRVADRRGRGRDADRDDDNDDDDDRETDDSAMEEQSDWPERGGNLDDVERGMPATMASRPPRGSTSDRRGRGTNDRRRGTRDAAMTQDSRGFSGEWSEVMSRAEILQPGIKLMTFDAAKPASYTVDALCRFRRQVLDQAYARDAEARQAVDGLLGGQRADFKSMTCDAATMLFNATSELMRGRNNSGIASPRVASNTGAAPATPADINAVNAKYYGIQR